MSRSLPLACLFVTALSLAIITGRLIAADLVATTPEEAAADPDFALQGEYEAPNLGVQVVALGKGEFQIVKFAGGLPGAGWNGKDRQVVDGDSEAVRTLVDSLKLKRTVRQSPTLGATPPKDAIVLFDGTQKSIDEHWRPGTKLSTEGLLIPAATTKEAFNDFTIHLEFRLPYMPKARGQGRANSGMYLHGRYEVQILDSFGLEGKDNECGGLYSIRKPDLNMCLPPLAWQTYDATFTAPRWDADGTRTSNARMTVRLNGVVIQQDVELAKLTPGALVKDNADPGPLFLQDHGNPVRFRNIWIQKREAEREARRPIVPAYERFFATESPASLEGGMVLMTELGCVNCHASNRPEFKQTGSRSGPHLDGVGLRTRAGWLAKFLTSPHVVKPGTTMPAVLDALPEAERDRAAKAIVSFLVENTSPPDRAGDRVAAKRGEELFHTVGCTACHAPRGKNAPAVNPAATIPLPVIGDKYTVVSLEKFLKDPVAIRPSGRMPSLNLNDKEARDIACYLVTDSSRASKPNLSFAAYHGSWDAPPDFSQLKPVKTGTCEGFDLSVGGRDAAYGIRFEGYWNVENEGSFGFYLTSDDGSKFYIDDELVMSYGGAFSKTPPRVLSKGVHKVRVDYVQAWGEVNLNLEFQGKGFVRQPLESWLRLTPEEAAAAATPMTDPDEFKTDPTLAAEGKTLFTSLGCAACHRVQEDGKALPSTLAAKPLAEVNALHGCLAEHIDPKSKAPQYDLSPSERASLTSALAAVSQPQAGARDTLPAVLASFNCYACHRRGGLGGPERDRDALFVTTQHEMGDEGRIPPPLDGVGDKLKSGWLKKVLEDGAKDRPYMKTRMPKFGAMPVDAVVASFVKTDSHGTDAKPPETSEPDHRLKAVGRKLAGNNALGCVKCHNFGNTKATGIQAMNLLTMTRRIREDWFYRYLPNPQAFRPGTRMPTAFVDGKSVSKEIYDGDPAKQMHALWLYLSDGDKAAIPDGLVAEAIELVAKETPVIYRNFLEGLTPRGIAVGYPEQADIAWDAERMSLAEIWHGRFVDASKHWTGRGADRVSPLGDHVVRIESTSPVAVLPSLDTPWPTQPPRERGYIFRGYRLDKQQRPAFLYELSTPAVRIEDFPIPAPDLGTADEPGIRRTLTLKSVAPVDNLYVRIARGTITQTGDLYSIGGDWKVRIKSTAKPVIRGTGAEQELLVPVVFEKGQAAITAELVW